MENYSVYEDIASRTNGDIYIGVVGPVRTGKSTFIKRFMEQLVIPSADESRRAVMTDELPQSAAGRTVMTTEPKFVPAQAAKISIREGAEGRLVSSRRPGASRPCPLKKRRSWGRKRSFGSILP